MVKLSDDYVRVNKTCISISRKLYDEIGAKDYASFHFHKYGGMTITFSDIDHYNFYELIYRSENVVSYRKVALEKYEGLYSGAVSGSTINAKRIKPSVIGQRPKSFYEIFLENNDIPPTEVEEKRMPLLIYENDQEP